MKQKYVILLAVSAAIGTAAQAQNPQRQATIVGGGNPNQGKCTIEVRVDGAAEVEIRGGSATLRTIAGAPAQWRRFECTSPMPVNPANFRFSGVDGRGRQSLVRDPASGGVAVVRIDDPDNGSEGYTFDITWNGNGGPGRGPAYQPAPPPIANRTDERRADERSREYNHEYSEDRYRPGYREGAYFKRYGHGFPTDEAIRVCQDTVSQQARERFRGAEIHFGRTTIEDNPGRNDFVIGSVDVHREGRYGREERFRFSCSVDFTEGRIRSAKIDDRPAGR